MKNLDFAGKAALRLIINICDLVDEAKVLYGAGHYRRAAFLAITSYEESMKIKIWIKNPESKNIFRHEVKFNEFKQTILRTTLDEWISMAEIFEVRGYYSAFPNQFLELINKICSDIFDLKKFREASLYENIEIKIHNKFTQHETIIQSFAHEFIGLADRCSIQLRELKLKAEMSFPCGWEHT